jgi:hypothetical protein
VQEGRGLLFGLLQQHLEPLDPGNVQFRRARIARARRWRVDAGVAVAAAVTIVLLAPVTSCRKKQDAPALAPVGSLPSGCAVAADLDRRALGQLGSLADSLFVAPGGTLIPDGLDLRHDVEHIRLCRFAPDPSVGDTTVLFMSGPIPGEVLDRIAARRADLGNETVAGVRALGGGHLWMAHRGPASSAGELLVTTTRAELRRALTEQPATYALDPAASFSIVLAPSEIRRLLVARRKGEDASPLNAVQEVRAALSPSGTLLDVRLVVGNDDVSRRLVYSLQSAVGTLLQKARPEQENIPSINLTVEGGDVVGRVEFPAEGLTAMATRLAALWARHPRGPR